MKAIAYALSAAIAVTGIIAFVPGSCSLPAWATHDSAKRAKSEGAAFTGTASKRVMFRLDPVAQTVIADERSFESQLPARSARPCSLAKEGRYVYFCAYHAYMLGTVVVK